ncbi:YdaS family helix-turn-helix protein [Nitrosomonas sp.]|uniref:YdaS family helix-turn-helix protein n=1 Tax=Nitrosomonas sp. TaxID=42353 RepID=UPI0025E15F3F|nr:YdaS family helix-turn-helix protein [Nitrosomonas sp.]MBY0484595.1 helix-turn-helix domain-containing protein [Nitrosomonas sp.]
MNKFKRYFKKLNKADQAALAAFCGLSLGYIAKVRAGKPGQYRFGTVACCKIEEFSKGVITRQNLRKDWKAQWPELNVKND